MNLDQKRILNRAIKAFGKEKQTEMMIEECSELILAIQKAKRYPNNESRKDLISEIADVRIMIEQMTMIYDYDDSVTNEIQRKIDRLESNLPPI